MNRKKTSTYIVIGFSLFVFGFLFVPVAVVVAQTATATFTPVPGVGLTEIVQPTMPSDFSCPEGLPSGWGTVTPNPFWEYQCSSCISTPWYTSTPKPPTAVPTWDGTGTPQPTNTPTATASPTSTQAPGISCAGGNLTCVSINSNMLMYTGSVENPTGYYSMPVYSYPIYFHFEVPVSDISANYGMYNYKTQADPGFYRLQNGGGGFSVDLTQGDLYVYGSLGVRDIVAGTYDYDFYGDGTHGFKFQSSSVLSKPVITNGTVLYVSTIPYVDPSTPTPTPTGQAGYCATVEDYTTVQDFSYSGIVFGALYCVDIGGFSFEILGISLDVPHVAHICFQDVAIGVLTLFGMSLSLDLVLGIFVAAWSLRNMFVS